MAYAALVSLVQTSDRILSDDLFSISVHNKQQIVALNENAIILQEFLDNFPEKANTLEGRLRDVANEAEDTIEYFMLKQVHSNRKWAHRLSKVASDKQLGEVVEEIESIAQEVMEIKNCFKIDKLQVGDESAAAASSSSSRTAPTDKYNDAMVGFDDDLLAIQDRLCGESSKLQVIPIYGMGGIGKTTLARNAYDDPLIMESFHVRAWITVSQDYSVKNILFSLLESFKEFNVERSGQSCEDKVYKSLKGRKYLIVMDEIWSTEVWDDLRNIFPDDGNGSRILLTTRLLDVATNSDSSESLYGMSLMGTHQSWKLLRQRVFKHQNCPPELEDIGKKIARSCRGLPLAIVVIAGLLSTVSPTPTSWKEIAKNVNSAVSAEDEQFEKILSLSYTHLPHHLRPCFLYMAGFPENRRIRVSNLIKLWVAEGFLIRSDGSKSLEDEAEDCLEDLVRRSLVLVIKRKTNNKIKIFSLHDLMWDLCIKKANEEHFFLYRHFWFDETFPYAASRESLRRLATSHSLRHISTFGPTIHTIRCFNHISLEPIKSFRLLRVLDLRDACAYVFPAVLFELYLLRYFGMNYISQIPAAISKLQNLQTLIIYNTGPWLLPREIWRMPRPRHILCCRSLPQVFCWDSRRVAPRTAPFSHFSLTKLPEAFEVLVHKNVMILVHYIPLLFVLQCQ